MLSPVGAALFGWIRLCQAFVGLSCIVRCSSAVIESSAGAIPYAPAELLASSHAQLVRSEDHFVPRDVDGRRGQRGRIDFVSSVAQSRSADSMDDISEGASEISSGLKSELVAGDLARQRIPYNQPPMQQNPVQYPSPRGDTQEQRVAAASAPNHVYSSRRGAQPGASAYTAYPNSPIPSGFCLVPMWSKTEYVCEESGMKRAQFKDNDGVQRRVMADDDKCTLICPGQSRFGQHRWHSPNIESMTCENGVFKNGKSKVKSIDCQPSERAFRFFWFCMVLGCVWIAYHFHVRKKNKEAHLEAVSQEQHHQDHHAHHQQPDQVVEPSTDQRHDAAPAQ